MLNRPNRTQIQFHQTGQLLDPAQILNLVSTQVEVFQTTELPLRTINEKL